MLSEPFGLSSSALSSPPKGSGSKIIAEIIVMKNVMVFANRSTKLVLGDPVACLLIAHQEKKIRDYFAKTMHNFRINYR